MPLELVLLTFMSLVAYVIRHVSHNIINGLCHSLGLGFVTTTYVTKESYVINHYAMKAYVIKVCFNSNLVYYVTRTYAIKLMSLKFIISLRLLSFRFDVNVIRAFICH
jgi:hypothetical protein